MQRLLGAIFWSALTLLCVERRARASGDYLILARRSGVIEFLDPASLKTLSTITLNVTPESTGLNGVFADPDGRTIYVEGPVGANAAGAGNCCWLYAVELPAVQAKAVAGIWGTRSFVHVGTGLLQPVTRAAPIDEWWQSSADGRWWVGLKNGPAVKLYDVGRREIVRSFALASGQEIWSAHGTWLGNRFYIFGVRKGASRMWTVGPESTDLGDGAAVPQLGQVPGCAPGDLINVTAAGERLLVYEVFGSKLDRREGCDDVPGGAWMLDPETGRFVVNLTPDLHFWMVVPNRSGSEVYGITSEVASTQSPAELVRMDATTGKVLEQRALESDYWWITAATLHAVPSGSVSVTLPDNLP